MKKQFIEYHTQIDYWKNLTPEYKDSLFKDNKNQIFFCAHCGAQLIVANMGKDESRPYFRAKNSHLQLLMNYPCKPGKKNNTIKPEVESKKHQANMLRVLKTLLDDEHLEKEENQDRKLKIKKQNKANNIGGMVSIRTEAVRELPKEFDKIKRNTTYKFRKTLKIRYFNAYSDNEYIYINNINDFGPELSIRVSLKPLYFEKLRAFHEQFIDIAIVIYITKIMHYFTKEDDQDAFYIPIDKESQMKYEVIK